MVSLPIAALLGALVGMEREHHGRSAGFRTHMLVAIGACLAMIVGREFAMNAMNEPGSAPAFLRIDPTRVVYGLMAGIGFLGAGTIMRNQPGVKGLTTAASLWCTAAVGLTCGAAMYLLAVTSTGLILLALTILNRAEKYFITHHQRRLKLSFTGHDRQRIERLTDTLDDHGVRIARVERSMNLQADTERLTLLVAAPAELSTEDLSELLRDQDGLKRISVS
jgi:putative Mg2+ transporter-C (MgtC) family protein